MPKLWFCAGWLCGLRHVLVKCAEVSGCLFTHRSTDMVYLGLVAVTP